MVGKILPRSEMESEGILGSPGAPGKRAPRAALSRTMRLP